MKGLSTEQLQQFSEEGYLVLSGLLCPDRVDRLARAWEAIRDHGIRSQPDTDTTRHPVLRNILASTEGYNEAVGGKVSLHIEHAFRYHREFRDLVYDDALVGIAESVLGDDVRLLDDQFYYKPAHFGGLTHWHRDSDYFLSVPVLTLWVPLDDVDQDNGCLIAVPQSHKQTFVGITSTLQGVAPDPTSLERLYKVDQALVQTVSIAMKRGDGLLIHRDLLHCSFENRSGRERKSYLIEYFAGQDFEKLKQRHPVIFGYHERYRYNYLLRRAPLINEFMSAIQGKVARLRTFSRWRART